MAASFRNQIKEFIEDVTWISGDLKFRRRTREVGLKEQEKESEFIARR